MNGVVVGGWSYVVAAYSITAIVLLAYAASLFIRLTEDRGPRTEDRR
jgi:hypothetical protein